MKTVVVYRSKSGYTRTYAEWIAEELQCDLKIGDNTTIEDLDQYDVIIYGGGLYAVGVNGISLIKNNLDKLHSKKLIVWATGSSPGREEELGEVWAYNFTPEQMKKIKTFYLRGGFDYKKLSTGDKVLMRMLQVRLKLIKDRTEDQQGMLEAYHIPEYYCNKENINPLIEYVRSL
ncbi:MAG TPA: flavodoxin domain-containing protein [Lachnospiraceae bacterium]|nr:flavodoxin domain-containing protein [Lachnospiraceae bacterium]